MIIIERGIEVSQQCPRWKPGNEVMVESQGCDITWAIR